MSEETNTPEPEEAKTPQYTPEELAAMRNKMTAFYKDEIKHLKHQEEYERLLADIEEHKTRRYTMMVRHAQMSAQLEEASEEEQPKQKRKLKTD